VIFSGSTRFNGTTARPQRDLLDQLRDKQSQLEGKEGELEESIQEAKEREQEAALFKERFPREVKRAAHERIDRSIRVRFGQAMQTVLPWISPFHPDDFQWVGGVIDGILWHGLHSGHVKRVIFVEEKAGLERLNPNQVEVQSAIEEKRVSFTTIRVPQELKRLMEKKVRPLLTE